MAICTMGNFRFPAEARVRLTPDGGAVVEANTHDIGTGTQTIFVQIAAEVLGLPVEAVSMEWGDTDLPKAGPVHGSSATMCTGERCSARLRTQAKLAALLDEDPVGLDVREGLRRTNAHIVGNGQFALAGDALRRRRCHHALCHANLGSSVRRGRSRSRLRAPSTPSRRGQLFGRPHHQSQDSAQPDDRRAVWGWGMATMERSEFEPTHARWLAKNLSNVAIPVNADIPSDITIHFVDEFDHHASPTGARGIGSSPRPESLRQWQTRFRMRPASAYAICRSRQPSCCPSAWETSRGMVALAASPVGNSRVRQRNAGTRRLGPKAA